MDKVYVLTIVDVSGGTLLVDKIEVYCDYKKAKRQFDLEVKEYINNNDFSCYHVHKSDNDFTAYEDDNYLNEHIEIHIKECNIII